MTAIEQKKRQINSFLSYCFNSKGETFKDAIYKNVSKVVCERYPTQDVEIVKVFFRSKGRQTNNIPFTFHEELPVGTAQKISDDLLDVRTTTTVGYGSIDVNKENKPTDNMSKEMIELLSN